MSQRRFPDEYPNAQYADADTGQSDRIDKARRAHSILYTVVVVVCTRVNHVSHPASIVYGYVLIFSGTRLLLNFYLTLIRDIYTSTLH